MIEMRPQKHSELYPYDGGWALWDTVLNEQVGWCKSSIRAKEFCDVGEETKGTSAVDNPAPTDAAVLPAEVSGSAVRVADN